MLYAAEAMHSTSAGRKGGVVRKTISKVLDACQSYGVKIRVFKSSQLLNSLLTFRAFCAKLSISKT